jgi:hypothetical protein
MSLRSGYGRESLPKPYQGMGYPSPKKYTNFIKVFEPECRYAPVMAANRYQNLTKGRVTPKTKKVVVTKTLPRDGLPQALKK